MVIQAAARGLDLAGWVLLRLCWPVVKLATALLLWRWSLDMAASAASEAAVEALTEAMPDGHLRATAAGAPHTASSRAASRAAVALDDGCV